MFNICLELFGKWLKLFEIKQDANIAIEEKRANKEIGSSLEAEINTRHIYEAI